MNLMLTIPSTYVFSLQYFCGQPQTNSQRTDVSNTSTWASYFQVWVCVIAGYSGLLSPIILLLKLPTVSIKWTRKQRKKVMCLWCLCPNFPDLSPIIHLLVVLENQPTSQLPEVWRPTALSSWREILQNTFWSLVENMAELFWLWPDES